MEWISGKDGFGIVELNSKERGLLERLKDFAENKGKKRYFLSHEEYPEHHEFFGIARDLFPNFPFRKSSSAKYYGVSFRNKKDCFGDYFIDFKPYDQLIIESRLPPGIDCDLQVLFSEKVTSPNFPIGAIVRGLYNYSAVDDLTQILGSRENPEIKGIVNLKTRDSYREWDKGIAEVPFLDKFLLLYDKAKNLVTNSKELTGVTENELGVLRKDSIHNDNLAIRDLSKLRYQEELQRLVNF